MSYIFPKPQQIIIKPTYLGDKRVGKIVNDFSQNLVDVGCGFIEQDLASKTVLLISQTNDILHDEGYKLEIDESEIRIYAKTEQGAFYALMSLKWLFIQTKIESAIIVDEPDLKVRGVMIDISRSKVPTVETLKEMIDWLSSLKYNHIELYVEGFSFEYQHFPQVLKEGNYLTLKQYLEIEDYAIKHYMDFVPNQNGFGHMGDWLKQDEFHYLAECPEGFRIWGSKRTSATLDPTHPDSIKLVQQMYQDMLPYTKSTYFNMNFDEPYELGHGRSKEQCEKTSIEDVYINYFNTLADTVRDYHKTPMLWGDVLVKHPEKVKELPKDVIFIDWGYHKTYDFLGHAKMLEENNVQYILAPGTATWSTITGRYIDMKTTIENSTSAAKAHQGLGILLTDWGDIGHLQYLPSSYIGFAYGAILSWSKGSIEDAKMCLRTYVKDDYLAKAIVELSTYHELEGEYRDYGSRLFNAILWSEHSQLEENKMDFYLDRMRSNLLDKDAYQKVKKLFEQAKVDLNLAKDSLEKREMENGLSLLEVLLEINDKLKSYIEGCVVSFEKEVETLKQYLIRHKQLWNARNIQAGYVCSANRINWLIDMLMHLDRKEKI